MSRAGIADRSSHRHPCDSSFIWPCSCCCAGSRPVLVRIGLLPTVCVWSGPRGIALSCRAYLESGFGTCRWRGRPRTEAADYSQRSVDACGRPDEVDGRCDWSGRKSFWLVWSVRGQRRVPCFISAQPGLVRSDEEGRRCEPLWRESGAGGGTGFGE